jgi:hypothetical protein
MSARVVLLLLVALAGHCFRDAGAQMMNIDLPTYDELMNMDAPAYDESYTSTVLPRDWTYAGGVFDTPVQVGSCSAVTPPRH